MSGGAMVWGLPLAPLTRQQAVQRVEELIVARQPSYFITANTHYAMLTSEVKELGPINQAAAFILADGAPLVLASRLTSNQVPERVAGSDLIYDLCALAAEHGFRVYLLGGLPGIADEAARKLVVTFPRLQIVGTVCPDPSDLLEPKVNELIAEIRGANPDILFVALGQPKGELWISRHLEALNVPVAAQVGATLDFVAGRVQRAPKLFQKTGMEWAFRIYTDPGRLGPRYWKNACFLVKQVLGDRFRRIRQDRPKAVPEVETPVADIMRASS